MPLIGRFMGLSGPKPGSWTSEVPRWLKQSERRATAAVEALRDSMYENFGRQVIDDEKAKEAYEQTGSNLRRRIAIRVRHNEPSGSSSVWH